jgi:hypothetical protein
LYKWRKNGPFSLGICEARCTLQGKMRLETDTKNTRNGRKYMIIHHFSINMNLSGSPFGAGAGSQCLKK